MKTFHTPLAELAALRGMDGVDLTDLLRRAGKPVSYWRTNRILAGRSRIRDDEAVILSGALGVDVETIHQKKGIQ
jgi:hypothetical protein